MSRNNITTLAAGVTQSLPHLKTLLLAGNMMESSSLSHHNLQHLSYLDTLDIAQNRLAGYTVNARPSETGEIVYIS